MRREHRDRVISLDINVRPTLIRNRDGYLARIDRLATLTDLVKLSDEDLAWLTPGGSFEALADRFQKLGTQVVVLTRGSEGSVVVSRDLRAEVAAVAVVRSPTDWRRRHIHRRDTGLARAAGEAHQTRSVHAFTDDLTAMLSFSAKAAAITVSRPGADPPWLRELV